MRNLIPDGVYTMRGHWAEPIGELLTVPFGGLPNTIVPDDTGSVEFCRELAFCPLDLAPDGSELQFLSLNYIDDPWIDEFPRGCTLGKPRHPRVSPSKGHGSSNRNRNSIPFFDRITGSEPAGEPFVSSARFLR